MHTTPPTYVTLSEASQLLHVSVWKVRRLFDAGLLQGTRSAKGDRMVLRTSLEQYRDHTKSKP